MTTQIRNANLLDVAELRRLLAATAHTVMSYLSRGHLLVLASTEGTLHAACHLEVDRDRAAIDLLVVDPAQRDATIRPRMVGVASALCEAHGWSQPMAARP